jgi:hypothetical protein|tara:strand:+ start:387 stop:578 length:192 start_codon:yes stop_codon:yes gene_type:complete
MEYKVEGRWYDEHWRIGTDDKPEWYHNSWANELLDVGYKTVGRKYINDMSIERRCKSIKGGKV